MPAKKGLYANINRRKKLGISRSKKKSTISKKAYANMKAGFPKKKKKATGGAIKSVPAELKKASRMHAKQAKTVAKHLKGMSRKKG